MSLGLYQAPKSMAIAFVMLARASLLADQHISKLFELAKGYLSPASIAHSLIKLHQHGLLTDEHQTMVFAHQNPEDAADALGILAQNELLTPAYQTEVLAYNAPSALATVLSYLHQARFTKMRRKAAGFIHGVFQSVYQPPKMLMNCRPRSNY